MTLPEDKVLMPSVDLLVIMTLLCCWVAAASFVSLSWIHSSSLVVTDSELPPPPSWTLPTPPSDEALDLKFTVCLYGCSIGQCYFYKNNWFSQDSAAYAKLLGWDQRHKENKIGHRNSERENRNWEMVTKVTCIFLTWSHVSSFWKIELMAIPTISKSLM